MPSLALTAPAPQMVHDSSKGIFFAPRRIIFGEEYCNFYVVSLGHIRQLYSMVIHQV